MNKEKWIQKTAKDAESQTIREESEESLETVTGGVQPKPKAVICKHCLSIDGAHAVDCPINPRNIVPRL